MKCISVGCQRSEYRLKSTRFIRIIAPVILLLLAPKDGFPAPAPEVSASRIVQATLFSDQALITREANTPVKQGVNEIWIGLDAFQPDPYSIIARIFGDGELHGVQFRRIVLQDAPQENIRALEEKIKRTEYDLQSRQNC